jgi:hypothetical protein
MEASGGMAMAELSAYRFTSGSDQARASNWRVRASLSAYALGGDDEIRASGSPLGTFRAAAIDLGTDLGPDGYAIANEGLISTGAGSDLVRASVQWRRGVFWDETFTIVNKGRLDLGDGNDAINADVFNVDAYDGLIHVGLQNEKSGTIVVGHGDDVIQARGMDLGLYNKGSIFAASGNDDITGVSTPKVGIGAFTQPGLLNLGLIHTGRGNDRIAGSGVTSPSTGEYEPGIRNYGRIDTGYGDDTIDALHGGFRNHGPIALGAGQDTLIGFTIRNSVEWRPYADHPNFPIDGGKGSKDKILLGQGVYRIYKPLDKLRSDGLVMKITGFEFFGGVEGGLFPLAAGMLQVGRDGVAVFSPL